MGLRDRAIVCSSAQNGLVAADIRTVATASRLLRDGGCSRRSAGEWSFAQLRFQTRNAVLHDAPVRLRIGHAEIQLVAEGAVAADVWTRRHDEQRELKIILKLVRPNTTFIDVGANVGLFALAAANFPSVRVYALEPASKTYELLRRNVVANGLTNVTPIRAAAGGIAPELAGSC